MLFFIFQSIQKGTTISSFGKFWQNNIFKNIQDMQHKLRIKHTTHKHTEQTLSATGEQ